MVMKGKEMDKIKRIQELVEELNKYRNAYYNENNSLITDEEYDKKFDELKQLEDETQYILGNSPTQEVGAIVQSKFNKVKHDHPMLSLDKTKSYSDLVKFCDGQDICCSLKMDGLTLSLSYNKDGYLIKAETRGDGIVGEDVLANVSFIENIPQRINNYGLPLTIDGEIIVKKDVFDKQNSLLLPENRFSHPRNYASGSLRQLNPQVTAERKLTFIPWKLVDGFHERHDYYTRRLFYLSCLGFTIVPYTEFNLGKLDKEDREEFLMSIADTLKTVAEGSQYPIDGLVFTYDNTAYRESLGTTSHHPLHSIAFKFSDEKAETTLRDIEWNVGKSGMVAPTAVFDPVELDGAIITRASLFNVSIIKNLKIGIGDHIEIIRANQVIPKVESNLTQSDTYTIPSICPSCGKELVLKSDGKAEMLWCVNPNCPAKKLSRFTQFVSKHGMNIEGLSEATLEKLIDCGMIKTFRDIFHLDRFKSQLLKMEGFGEKSYNKLIESINNAKSTTLENVLVSLSIPNIGRSAAKTISTMMDGSLSTFMEALNEKLDFSCFKDFGATTNEAIYNFFFNEEEKSLMDNFFEELQIKKVEKKEIKSGYFTGKKFCITGSFSVSRDQLKERIEEQGGIFVSGVSKKLDVLVAGEKAGSKLKKAEELGIEIIMEDDLKKYLNY